MSASCILRYWIAVPSILAASLTLHGQSPRVLPVFDITSIEPTSCDCGGWSCLACDDGCAATPDSGDPRPRDMAPDPRQQRDPGTDSAITDPLTAPELPLAAPDAEASPGLDVGSFASTLGATSGGLGVPGMIGDIFGGAPTQYILGTAVTFNNPATGFVVSPGNAAGFGASIAYELNGGQTGNDFFSVGTGVDTDGDGLADTYGLSQPTPPSPDIPPPPGPAFTFQGTATAQTTPFAQTDQWDLNYGYVRQLVLLLPDPGTLVVGRMKIAENTSPIPRHRVFFQSSLFDDVPLIQGGVDVERFNPGFEKTFWNEQASIEMRFPFAATLDSNILGDGTNDLDNIEFGNVFVAAKFLLLSTNAPHRPTTAGMRTNVAWDFSAGVSFSVPTADDVNVGLVDGTPLVRIENDAVHVMPFVGWVGQSRTGWFTQGFVQVDADANGNGIAANFQNSGLRSVGRVQAATFLYIDVGIGRTIAMPGYQCLRGITPVLELHYNRSLQAADFVQSGNFRVGQPRQDTQTLHLVMGNTFHLGRSTTATLGYATPIGNGSDRMFDGELQMLLNRFF